MKNNLKFNGVLAVLFVMTVGFTSKAQIEYAEDMVSWKFTVEQSGDVAYIVGTITMIEHWHIYAANLPEGAFSIPTDIVLPESPNYKVVGKIIEPNPVHEHVAGEDLYYHSNTVKMKQKIKILTKEDFTIKAEFSFQTCDDTHCLKPFSTEVDINVKGAEEEEEEKTEAGMFDGVTGDEFTDEEGKNYVKVNDQWHTVPEGNSMAFYKKYITLQGKDEE